MDKFKDDGNFQKAHVFRKQATQRLAEFGTMGVPIHLINFRLIQKQRILPQSAHKTRCTAGPGTNSMATVVERDAI